jgi:hemin uptake protein HemP
MADPANNSSADVQVEAPGNAAGDSRTIGVTAHRIDSRDLFIGTREITILHVGELYRLRLTAQNKLILTK